jgi:hypothetical protein
MFRRNHQHTGVMPWLINSARTSRTSGRSESTTFRTTFPHFRQALNSPVRTIRMPIRGDLCGQFRCPQLSHRRMNCFQNTMTHLLAALRRIRLKEHRANNFALLNPRTSREARKSGRTMFCVVRPMIQYSGWIFPDGSASARLSI